MAETMSIAPSPAWGVARIYGEGGSLLRRHFRLFLPSILFFWLPDAIRETLFLALAPAAPTPAELPSLPETVTNLGANLGILSIMVVAFIATGMLGLCKQPANLCIVAHIYTVRDVGTEGTVAKLSTWDIFRRLFPSALLPIVVTGIWFMLFDALVTLIVSVDSVVSSVVMKFLLFCYIVPVLVPLAIFVAVLEREKYGLAAVKKGFKLARRRAATVTAFAV